MERAAERIVVTDLFGKLMAFGAGAALVVVFGALGVDALRDYRTFGDAPDRLSLDAAAQASASSRRWVSVVGGPWRCADVLTHVDGGAAFLPAMAIDGSIVVARFDRPIRCEAVAAGPLTGIIEPMAAGRAADLRAAGLTLPPGAALRTLDVCAFCGKGNARMGVVVCAAVVVLGLLLYPLRRAYLAWSIRMRAALDAAIHAPPDRAAEGDRRVRLWGGVVLAAGAVALALGEGWVAYGVVPVRWLGVLGLALGGWMAAFPAGYRRFLARRR